MSNSVMWQPTAEQIEQARMTDFMRTINRQQQLQLASYHDLHAWSVAHSPTFWRSLWDYCDVIGEPGEIIVKDADKLPGASWFPQATLNFAENLLRYRDDRIALIFRGENGSRQQLSYAQLYQLVAALAAAMRKDGIVAGDRVAGMMPNCIETVIAMLATTSIGAVWSSCSPDFGVQGVVDRFGQITPKLLITIDGYFYNGKTIDIHEKVAAIREQLPSLQRTLVVPFAELNQTLAPGCDAWDDYLIEDANTLHFEPMPFNAPLYIMFSSGTTGVPKCIVHGIGGTLLQHLKEHALHTDIRRDDVFFYFTTCGWMMWNWLVSGLAQGATLVLFDGSPFAPSPAYLWQVADEEGITVFGTSAKYLSALEKAGYQPKQQHSLTQLRTILTTGSVLAPENFDYVYRDIKADLCLSSISGGTDIVSCFALGNPILPVYRGELQCRGLALDVQVFNEQGNPVTGEKGELVCLNSFPCMPLGFWNDNQGERYFNAYFARFNQVWAHGDYAEITQHQGVIIYGRSDAVLNPGGVRIGTAEIYRQVEKVEAVLESIAVGQRWQDDERVVLFVRLRDGLQLNDALQQQIRQTIRTHATPRHVPAIIAQVADIPRTISGKIVELAVRQVIHNEPVKNTDALANPEALQYFVNRPELQE
ncbi:MULTISPECIES: acetoacetate--CoA ligase [Pseudidiomarina]|uniref:Acetoacetyl-CoA synthetase n=2 Tax=Pseudidiomarina TaxID=2800384 RepID=A0A368V0W7_9GAMM|nr:MULTISPECIES: acetoacetate--CoA ligase [Pseudidiomarina]PWW14367.1 acetoacetyl-CoA synthetase [Pseudidiomarina maritima]RBP92633.1 acetoacetyl-CoA synthetase [Pseudidiomarina tainanensis]RCW34443.1 acetoacetyl-CoA synthetase [Pseudidiomarina tainanensis]